MCVRERDRERAKDLQVMLAMAESAVICRSAAILLATKSGHDVPAAKAVNAMV